MSRWAGGTTSLLHQLLVLTVLHLRLSDAGPLGPMANVTSLDLGFKEGSCAVGDVVYMSGDGFPGATPCERCTCSSGDVQCFKQRCEPRPGCKALHRPDHCCPTYQCDCEQEGRVYSNGEKLVDPNDPCRVCYCQGGEVVCRRIVCFMRDDCRPRQVPGRCCPEYDNCPLRGVTSLPGVPSQFSSVSSIEEITINAAPSPSKEPVKQEITIKEITPVSEIPVKADVKIKEVLSSSGVEEVEFASSKSPLIPREATTERNPTNEEIKSLAETPAIKPSLQQLDPLPNDVSTESISSTPDSKRERTDVMSEISVSTNKDAVSNSSKIPYIIPLMGSPLQPVMQSTILTTKVPILEDEDAPFDHNPAFPPIPDDLSVAGNHEDEIVPEQNMDNDHVPNERETIHPSNMSGTTAAPVFNEASSVPSISEAGSVHTERSIHTTTNFIKDELTSTTSVISKNNSMLNLRSVIPTEILDTPSLISNDTTEDLLDVTDSSEPPTTGVYGSSLITASESELKITEKGLTGATGVNEGHITPDIRLTTVVDNNENTTLMIFSTKEDDKVSVTSKLDDMSPTTLNSIAIETNTQDIIENVNVDKISSTTETFPLESLPTGRTADSEVITVLADVPAVKDDKSYEYIETTEFIVTPYYPEGSNDGVTEAVELIKIYPNGEETSEIVLRPKINRRNNNVLTDLINLVGDVASIPDRTDQTLNSESQTLSPSSVLNSNSEELIPVNAGYKSKNYNWNVNSITEIPFKNKNSIAVNKQKVVEIEDDESDSITDSPPPYDRVEPTTRRPIIDHVSDDKRANRTGVQGKKDIEIITQSYVPTINKNPTKVVLKEDNDTFSSAELITSNVVTASTAAVETTTVLLETKSARNTEEDATDGERIANTTETTTTAQ